MKKPLKTQAASVMAFICFIFCAGCSKTSVTKAETVVEDNAFTQSAPVYVVSTLVDHIASPQGLTIDGLGNLFVVASANGSIEKISPSGLVTTITDISPGVNSVPGTPEGIAIDAQKNLYFTDATGGVINRITSSGLLSTVAGNNTNGNADGMGVAAQFNRPFGITIDGQGNLYVTDAGNASIRKIAPSGLVSTLKESASGGAEGCKSNSPSLGRPEGIAIDDQGNLYITDVDNAAIMKITSSGNITTIAGGHGIGYADGTGLSAKFNKPFGIAVDGQGNLYVADAANAAIRKITPSRVVTTIAGGKAVGFADGIGMAAKFDSPEGIAIDSQGNLFVSDGCYGAIRKITLE